MTDHTLPASGGAYIREKDGTLRLVEEPTAMEAPVQAPLEDPVKAAATPTFKSSRKEAP
jgi:hypothetical protein